MMPYNAPVGIKRISYVGGLTTSDAAPAWTGISYAELDFAIASVFQSADSVITAPGDWTPLWAYTTALGSGGRHYGWGKLLPAGTQVHPVLSGHNGRNSIRIYRGAFVDPDLVVTYAATVAETDLVIPALALPGRGWWGAYMAGVRSTQTAGWGAAAAPTGTTSRVELSVNTGWTFGDTNGISKGWAEKHSTIASAGVIHSVAIPLRPLHRSDY